MGKCAVGVLTGKVGNSTVMCNISQTYLKELFFSPIECPYQSQIISDVSLKIRFLGKKNPEVGNPSDCDLMISSGIQAALISLL